MLKKCTLVIILILFYTLGLFSQVGKIYDSKTLPSSILNRDCNYAVYLPPNYDSSERDYPVLYLLHGAGDNHTAWVQFGEIAHAADELINSGKATAMIIVMPDAETHRRGYFNALDEDWAFEDFFFEELMPHVESTYRIKAQKRYRAIAGLSMGGDGTIYFALHHPELFSAACPLSCSGGPFSDGDARWYMTGYKSDGASFKKEQVNDFINTYKPINLISESPIEDITSLRWYISCGDDDTFSDDNCLIHNKMIERGIPHEFRMFNGDHNWTYWRAEIYTVLEFITTGFHNL